MKLLWVLALAVPCLTFDIANPVFDGFPVEKLLGTHYHAEENWQYPAKYLFNSSWTVRDSRIPDESAKEAPVGKYECPPDSEYCARRVVSNKDGGSVVTFLAYDTAEPEIEFIESRWGTSFEVRYSTKLAEEQAFEFSITLTCSPDETVGVFSATEVLRDRESSGYSLAAIFVNWHSESFCRYGKYVDPEAKAWGPYVYLAVASGFVGHLLGQAIMRVRHVGIRQFTDEILAVSNNLMLTVLGKTGLRRTYRSLSDD